MATTNVGAAPVSMYANDVVVRLHGGANLWEVADALAEADIGALAIDERDRVTAVVSERDVVHALAARRDPTTTKASDIARAPLVCCDASSTVAAVADEMMQHYVRHVLLQHSGHVVGIVSARDLLGAYASADSTYGLGRL
jgi:CBS domain-containing protein